MKPSTSWKNWEGWICSIFGGRRRGADYADRRGGKNDCLTEGFSIETKFMARPTFSIMLQDARKAVERKESPLDVGIGIMRKKGSGSRMDTTLVYMTLREFLDFYGPVTVEEAEQLEEIEDAN